jgi:hypothetical protein
MCEIYLLIILWSLESDRTCYWEEFFIDNIVGAKDRKIDDLIYVLDFILLSFSACRGRDRTVVEFTTSLAISVYHN